jgi:hypothetical protein
MLIKVNGMGEKIKLITYNNLVYIGKHGACALM